MASFQNVSSGDSSTGTLNITKNSGLALNDLMVLHVYAFKTGSLDPGVAITGWTQLNNSTFTQGANVRYQYLFYKIATSGDVAASTFTVTSSSATNLAGAISRWSGTNLTTPISGYNFISTSTAVGTLTGAPVTPTANSRLAMFGVRNASGSFSGYTIVNNNPTWTEAYDTQFTTGGSSTLAMAYGDYPFTTTTGNASLTFDTTTQGVLHLLAITAPDPIQPTVVGMTTSLLTATYPIVRSNPIGMTMTLIAPTVISIRAAWSNITKHISTWLNRNKS